MRLRRELVRRRVQLVLLVREPQPAVRVEHLLAQARQELLEHPTPIDARLLLVELVHERNRDLRAQVEDDLLWLRKPFLDDTSDHGVLVVHGHTPVKKIQHKGNRLDIDTGAAHGGPVSGVRLDDDGVWLLTDKGPKPVAPPKNA